MFEISVLNNNTRKVLDWNESWLIKIFHSACNLYESLFLDIALKYNQDRSFFMLCKNIIRDGMVLE